MKLTVCCWHLKSMVLMVVALLTTKTIEHCDSGLIAAADLRALLETRLLRRAMEALPRKRLATTSGCCSWLVVAGHV